jgi:hypothetical protein
MTKRVWDHSRFGRTLGELEVWENRELFANDRKQEWMKAIPSSRLKTGTRKRSACDLDST